MIFTTVPIGRKSSISSIPSPLFLLLPLPLLLLLLLLKNRHAPSYAFCTSSSVPRTQLLYKFSNRFTLSSLPRIEHFSIISTNEVVPLVVPRRCCLSLVLPGRLSPLFFASLFSRNSCLNHSIGDSKVNRILSWSTAKIFFFFLTSSSWWSLLLS